ncbi:signal peptidase I [Virgibacillus sp. DJP39]|uniref:signal peptidase I n=1 Tax=Virgibacillus sp. DJP39 TaxID=3409790 RepID=UPI003BB6CF6C
MKVVSRIINVVLVIVVLCSLVAAIGSAITKEPMLLTVIRSNSMHPVWERGDMVIIENLKEEKTIHKEDIIFFKTEEGSLSKQGWIAHRVMSGSREEGFITKGDANKYTDQSSDGTVPIKQEWVAGKAITIGETPIVIPKIGYLSLWAEKFQSNPLLIPVIALVLAGLIAFGEIKFTKKRKKKSQGMELQLIYIVGGLTIAVIMGGTMLTSGQNLGLAYQVSDKSQGVIMGSDVGILKVGDKVSRPLSELSNNGAFPLIGTINTSDKQIELSHERVILSKGEQIKSTYTVKAEIPGKYESSIRVGLFYPFLPASLIYFLSEQSYWLALVSVSLVPGLPLMVYPFVNGKMRRKTAKLLRRKKRKIQSSLPF